MKKIETLCRRISNRECQSALKLGDLELAKKYPTHKTSE